MKNYVSQLILDIQRAHRIPAERSNPDEEISIEKQMEEVEKWATGDGSPGTLSQQSGLSVEDFPPPELLDQQDIEQIMQSFIELLKSYNICVDLPELLPIQRAYTLLVGLLEEEAWYLPGGFICQDFCDGDTSDCVLAEYCRCLKYMNNENKEMDLQTSSSHVPET
jgi:hypothetical protein